MYASFLPNFPLLFFLSLSSLFPSFVILFSHYIKEDALVLPEYKDSRERENSSVRFINGRDLAVFKARLQWTTRLALT